MAPTDLREFNNQWVLFGLLFFCLMTFSIAFTASNNTDGLSDVNGKFDTYSTGVQSRLVATDGNANTLLNITSQNNPEVSDLGSRDSVAVSYGITGTSKGFFEQFKEFFGWMVSGTSGQILISVFTGLFSVTALYFITKWIRQGV